MSKTPCRGCGEKTFSDQLHPCEFCFAPYCDGCIVSHKATHTKEPERIVKPAPKKHKKENDGSLSDA